MSLTAAPRIPSNKLPQMDPNWHSSWWQRMFWSSQRRRTLRARKKRYEAHLRQVEKVRRGEARGKQAAAALAARQLHARTRQLEVRKNAHRRCTAYRGEAFKQCLRKSVAQANARARG